MSPVANWLNCSSVWGCVIFINPDSPGLGGGSVIKSVTCYCFCFDNLLSNKQQSKAKDHINPGHALHESSKKT